MILKKRRDLCFLIKAKREKWWIYQWSRSLWGSNLSPTDEELIKHYLRLKNEDHDFEVQVIAEVDFYKFEPWELPGTLSLCVSVFKIPNLFYVSLNVYLSQFPMNLLVSPLLLVVSLRFLFDYGLIFFIFGG